MSGHFDGVQQHRSQSGTGAQNELFSVVFAMKGVVTSSAVTLDPREHTVGGT